jgi:CBS domain-containing protein
MLVSDVMHGDVQTIPRDESFARAAALLRERHVSSLVVIEDRRPSGILTERDVVNVVAEGLDPRATMVAERMTGDPVTAGPSMDLREAAQIMASRGIRHLPVVDGDALVGIVSIRDLLSWATDQLVTTPDLWPDLMAAIATEWPH